MFSVPSCWGCFCRSGRQAVLLPVEDVGDLRICAELSFGAILAQHFGVDGSLSDALADRRLSVLLVRSAGSTWLQSALAGLKIWQLMAQALVQHSSPSGQLIIPEFVVGESIVCESRIVDMAQAAKRYAILKRTIQDPPIQDHR